MTNVTIYEKTNFTGRSKELGEGTHRLQGSDLDRQASSIRVPEGMVAIVHDHADAKGGVGMSADFLEDHSDLSQFGFNDKVTFVEVFPAKQASGIVWARGSLSEGHYIAGHWKHPRVGGEPANNTVAVSPNPGLPRLLHISTVFGTAWPNPTFDSSDPDWARKIVGGSTFDGSAAHPFEWVSVLNPKMEQDDEVGLSGIAIGPELSGADLPFTHPFGTDFEFSILPDVEYEGLLAPSNKDPNGPYKSSWDAAHRARLPVAEGFLGLEIEAPLVPTEYRFEDRDRIAVYGRWIVDAGHPDFHTEIHPPLLMARAFSVDKTDKRTDPVPDSTTFFQLWSRPYQAGQLFTTDGDTGLPFREYAKRIAETLGDIEAYPPIFAQPFAGIHIVAFTVEAPPPQQEPLLGKTTLGEQLQCSYHFTTNGSCGLDVIPSPADHKNVLVIVTLSTASYPDLPEPPRSFETFSIADLLKHAPSGADIGWFEEQFLKLKKDVKVRRYAAPEMSKSRDSTNLVPFTVLNNLPHSSKTIDRTQPFPIYGWLKFRRVTVAQQVDPKSG